MKFIILITLLFVHNVLSKLVVPDNIKKSWFDLSEPHFTECACITGVSLTRANRFFTKSELPDDPRLKCFFKCLVIKLSILNEATNEWDETEIINKVAGVTPFIYSNCNNSTDKIKDLYERVFQMTMCLVLQISVPV
ncbi:hypothetical protein FQR65_LT06874 [Abscondita terminalis]|nr:hypothetical protein FQR65_LT06874 [Abscondita terminalis]